MEAEDLLAAAFPDAAACLENIPGDREVPDHPLVRQTIDDCLHEVMDLDGLIAVLRRIHSGQIRCIARDLPEPSPLAHEILNARPYAFLDDAPLEERRTQAVYTRRAFEPSSADDLGALDPAAIERVRDESWPEIQNADELHDTLLTSGFLTESEGSSWADFMDELVGSGRAVRVEPIGERPILWVAAERLQEAALLSDPGAREPAVRELFRGRLGIVGPTTGAALAATLGLPEIEAEAALVALEAEGVVLRGRFTPRGGDGAAALEWCDRRLLARIHRYTLNRLRAEIEPVSPADFMRFLFVWQRVDPEHRMSGLEGLAAVIAQLDGFELPAAAWESDVLAARVEEYDPALLDTLSLTGRVGWAAGQRGTRAGPIRSTPIALFQRQHAGDWLAGRPAGGELELSSNAARVREVLEQRGASFFHQLVPLSGLLATQVEQALGELAGLGLVTSDSFAGLRALITPSSKRKPPAGGLRRHRTVPFGIESAGRWALLREDQRSRRAEEQPEPREQHPLFGSSAHLLLWANALLLRYGVVFRGLLQHESGAPPWRDLLLTYRRLEARGEIRGGRFVAGLAGEQFALPAGVAELRAIRRTDRAGKLEAISAADPLNLTGVITPGERVPALAGNRILYQDGSPVMALVAGESRGLVPLDPGRTAELERALVRRPVSAALRAHLGIKGSPPSVLHRTPPRRRRQPVPDR
jgi:ATP-dependent Lhr-like helicase